MSEIQETIKEMREQSKRIRNEMYEHQKQADFYRNRWHEINDVIMDLQDREWQERNHE